MALWSPQVNVRRFSLKRFSPIEVTCTQQARKEAASPLRRKHDTAWPNENNKRREKFRPQIEFATASRCWIVHYHRLTIIDHLAVGLIDAGYVRDPKSSWRRARVPSSARLFLINKATSKCAICANRFIDGRNKTDAMGHGLAHLSIIVSFLPEDEVNARKRAMCTLRIIIALNAALKLAHMSHQQYKTLRGLH